MSIVRSLLVFTLITAPAACVADISPEDETAEPPVALANTQTSLPTLCTIGSADAPGRVVAKGASDLRKKLKKAGPGTVILVRDTGTYKGDYKLSKSGSASEPITIRAEDPSSPPEFKDAVFEVTGNHVVVTELDFNNSMLSLTGDHGRATRNEFRNGKEGHNSSRLADAINTNGANNRIDHNYVHDWKRRALRVVQVNKGTKNNRIDHNYLRNLKGSTNPNSGEAFQVAKGGSGVKYHTGTVIEYNLVDGFDNDSELLSIKSNGVIYRFNTQYDAPKSRVAHRFGDGGLFQGNVLRNVKALSVYGEDHLIIDNFFDNADIHVYAGNATSSQVKGNTKHASQGGYGSCSPRARDVQIVGNISKQKYNKIDVGKTPGNKGGCGSNHISAKDTKTYQNKNFKVSKRSKSGSVSEMGSYNGLTVSYVEMSVSDVGLDAADPFCQGSAEPASDCSELYGEVEGFELCEQTATSCAFSARKNKQASCDDVCQDHGGVCLEAFNNGTDACGFLTPVACSLSSHWDDICVCSR